MQQRVLGVGDPLQRRIDDDAVGGIEVQGVAAEVAAAGIERQVVAERRRKRALAGVGVDDHLARAAAALHRADVEAFAVFLAGLLAAGEDDAELLDKARRPDAAIFQLGGQGLADVAGDRRRRRRHDVDVLQRRQQLLLRRRRVGGVHADRVAHATADDEHLVAAGAEGIDVFARGVRAVDLQVERGVEGRAERHRRRDDGARRQRRQRALAGRRRADDDEVGVGADAALPGGVEHRAALRVEADDDAADVLPADARGDRGAGGERDDGVDAARRRNGRRGRHEAGRVDGDELCRSRRPQPPRRRSRRLDADPRRGARRRA